MKYKQIVVFLFLSFSLPYLYSQSVVKQWTLEECINYAFEHNLDIKKVQLSEQEDEIDRKQAIAAFFPSLSGSISQNYTHGQDAEGWSGSYSLGANVDLFRGLKNYRTLQQTKLQKEQTATSIQQKQYDIKISITQSYLQILYYQEALDIARKNMEVAQSQMERGKVLLEAGTSSKSEYAALQAQFAAMSTQVVTAQNALDNKKLQLKQLLELGIDDQMDIESFEIQESQILATLDDKKQIYQKALQNMPEMRMAELNKEMSALNYKLAISNCLPSLTLGGSIGTSNVYNTAQDFGEQMKNQFRQSLSLSLSVPIFTKLQTYATIQKAKLQQQSVVYDYAIAEKNMLQTIESLYQDALAAQAQYLSSKQQLEAVELSYELVADKFNLGMQNATDILVERNNLNIAQQNVLQAKFTALLSQLVLNIYQGV